MNVEMSAAIAAVWQKNLPAIRERLHLLQSAADDLAESRTIDDEARSEAVSAAHKFAGSLGMFGLQDATTAAREIEQHLEQPGLPQPERLQEQVARLATLLGPHLRD